MKRATTQPLTCLFFIGIQRITLEPQERRKGMSRPREVHQYDPDTGELVNTFESIAEAGRKTGIPRSDIHTVASGRRRYYAGKYIWSFEDPSQFTPPTREQVEKKKSKARKPRQVSQFDPDTGELIQTFESVAEAGWKTGTVKSSIYGAASGRQHYARGCIWSFEDPSQFTPPTREQVEKKKFENRSRVSKGIHLTEKHKKKISEANKGKQRPPKQALQYTIPDLELVKEHSSISEASRVVSCDVSTISRVLSDKHPNNLIAKGYHWSDHLLSEDEKRDVRAKLLKSPKFKNRAPLNK